MAKEGSVAPKERVNIVYKPATGGAQEEVELPLKMVVMGDFTGRSEDTPIEDREVIDINERFLVLLQTDDEVLDYRLAQSRYRHHDVIVEQGGNHRFENLSDYLQQIGSFSQEKEPE